MPITLAVARTNLREHGQEIQFFGYGMTDLALQLPAGKQIDCASDSTTVLRGKIIYMPPSPL
jgi:hypothetical protein